jgi:catechol 2,3-dioxygenase-like lactoylglutathione lyase family enzyme
MGHVPLDALTPYAHVADVQRSIDFYRRLGLEERNRHEEDGRLVWAFVTSPAGDPNDARARLMLALADEALDVSAQGVLFYCWAADVRGLHTELAAAGIEVGPVERPFSMPAGQFSLTDPDGYVVVVGQLGEPA